MTVSWTPCCERMNSHVAAGPDGQGAHSAVTWAQPRQPTLHRLRLIHMDLSGCSQDPGRSSSPVPRPPAHPIPLAERGPAPGADGGGRQGGRRSAPFAASLQAARLVRALSRRALGRGGTTLPGRVLTTLHPRATEHLARALRGSILVSGTNGKTTTARLLASAAREAQWPVAANTEGANLMSGVSTALLDSDGRVAVLEVDEAALPDVAAAVRPDVVVLLNLFRDQLDRYGELEHLTELWRRAVADLAPEAVVVACADDPAVADVAAAHGQPLYFTLVVVPTGPPPLAGRRPVAPRPGPAAPVGPGDAELGDAADSAHCRRCGTPLRYDDVTIAHLGSWHCPGCGSERPGAAVCGTLTPARPGRPASLHLATPKGELTTTLGLSGLHNAYNATAAAAAGLAIGLSLEHIGRALASTPAPFGRGERIKVGRVELVVHLTKNPTGMNEVLRTITEDAGPLDVLLLLNDRTADGRDVSWIWDVDLEAVVDRFAHVTVGGGRAADLGVRVHYAGLDEARTTVGGGTRAALQSALDSAEARQRGRCPRLYVLPTYTALLELRGELVARGVVDEVF